MNARSITKSINYFNFLKRNSVKINGKNADVSDGALFSMYQIGSVLIYPEFRSLPVCVINSEITNLHFLHGNGLFEANATSDRQISMVDSLICEIGVGVISRSSPYFDSLVRNIPLETVYDNDYIIAKHDYYTSKIGGVITNIRKLISCKNVSVNTAFDRMFILCYTPIKTEISCDLLHRFNQIISAKAMPVRPSNRELAMAESVVSYFVEKLEYYILSGCFTPSCDRRAAIKARSIALGEDGIPIVLSAIGRLYFPEKGYKEMIHIDKMDYTKFTGFVVEALCDIASSIVRISRENLDSAVSYYREELDNINRMRNMYSKLAEHTK